MEPAIGLIALGIIAAIIGAALLTWWAANHTARPAPTRAGRLAAGVFAVALLAALTWLGTRAAGVAATLAYVAAFATGTLASLYASRRLPGLRRLPWQRWVHKQDAGRLFRAALVVGIVFGVLFTATIALAGQRLLVPALVLLGAVLGLMGPILNAEPEMRRGRVGSTG